MYPRVRQVVTLENALTLLSIAHKYELELVQGEGGWLGDWASVPACTAAAVMHALVSAQHSCP